MFLLQATWAGLDPVVKYLASDPSAPRDLKVARLAHPTFSQFMAEYLVAQVVNHERRFYQVTLLLLCL